MNIVDERNRPFTPQYPLWSDGAVKRRWVFLPPGTTIDIRDDGAWEFPVGTRFWKEFSFDGRKVETRMLWKATAAQWVTVSYLWNDAQTDAILASDRGEPGVASLGPNRRHSVPSANDCLACHGVKRTEPLGFNPLQLSTDRDPTAIHGEALAPGSLTLAHACRPTTRVADENGSPRRAAAHSQHERADPEHAWISCCQLRQLPPWRR